MFICEEKFNYVDKSMGVTKDGEKYLSLNVIPINDQKKYNFLTKDDEIINLINSLEFKRFQEITLQIKFIREFNFEKRTSYWFPQLVGVDC